MENEAYEVAGTLQEKPVPLKLKEVDVEYKDGGGSDDSLFSDDSSKTKHIGLIVIATVIVTAAITFGITYPVTKNNYDVPCLTSSTERPTTVTTPTTTTAPSTSTVTSPTTTPTSTSTTPTTTTTTTTQTTTTAPTTTTTTPIPTTTISYADHVLRSTSAQTLYGEVEGTIVDMSAGTPFQDVMSFKGIPFAKAGRWEKPGKPDSWIGALYGKTFGARCPPDAYESEDCLFLNIYTPMDAGLSGGETFKYPVMLWIHGGGYQFGSGRNYPGHMLADRGVVLVTINYRLGIYGFASTEDGSLPGNYGLWDQQEAMNWVQENIEAFGGDKDDVTIFGQSAGGTSVGLQLISPHTAGLFHRAIPQSGNEMNFWAVNSPAANPGNYLVQVAEQLNCSTSTPAEMVSCLKLADFNVLQRTPFKCETEFCLGFAPVVDGDFVPKMPIEMLKDGDFNDVDIMIGSTTNECNQFLLGVDPLLVFMGLTRKEFEATLSEVVNYFSFVMSDGNPSTPEMAYEAIKFMYTPWPNYNDPELNKLQMGKMCTDVAFSAPANMAARFHASKNKVYEYQYNLKYSRIFPPEIEWFGITHSYEQPYVWGHPQISRGSAELQEDANRQNSNTCWHDDDIEWSNYVITLWTNFAKYGNPTPEPLSPPGMSPIVWEQFTNTSWNYLYITKDDVQVKQNYRAQETAFYYDYLYNMVSGDRFLDGIHQMSGQNFTGFGFDRWAIPHVDLLETWMKTWRMRIELRDIDLQDILPTRPIFNRTSSDMLDIDESGGRVKRQLKPPKVMPNPLGNGFLQSFYDGLTYPQYLIIKAAYDSFIDNNPDAIERLTTLIETMEDSPVDFKQAFSRLFSGIQDLFGYIYDVNQQCSLGYLPDLPAPGDGNAIRDAVEKYLEENNPQALQLIKLILSIIGGRQ